MSYLLSWLELGHIGIFTFTFLVNMLPFSSPSNLVLAASISINISEINPLIVGVLVASGSTLAKLAHYYISFYGARVLDDKTRNRLENYGCKVGGLGAIILFLAAASPIPDDPIIVALGVVKYHPLKFLAVFFSGKMVISTLGAWMGNALNPVLTSALGDVGTAVISVILTIVVTIFLIKIDVEKMVERIRSGI
jgi:membrane protein YqaA with SNARE-associated domain